MCGMMDYGGHVISQSGSFLFCLLYKIYTMYRAVIQSCSDFLNLKIHGELRIYQVSYFVNLFTCPTTYKKIQRKSLVYNFASFCLVHQEI